MSKAVRIFMPEHPNANAQGHVYEHVLKASIAIGRAIPEGVEIHHVNKNPLDNSNSNLVICQDKAYHQLLHRRLRVLEAGGNPDTDKWCTGCKTSLPLDRFVCDRSRNDGKSAKCRECVHKYARTYRAANLKRIRQAALEYHLANRGQINARKRQAYSQRSRQC